AHLLRRPGGRDVFALRHNHALLDHGAALALLRRLDELAGGSEVAPAAHPGWRDPVWAHLRGFPRKLRREAARDAGALWVRQARAGAVQLGDAPRRTGPVRLRVAAARLEAPATRAVQAAVAGACGLPSLSMALLGSAFRAVDRLAPAGQKSSTFLAGIGLDLGARAGRPPMGNWTSLIPIAA